MIIHNWSFRSEFTTRGDSDIGVGIGTTWGNATNNLIYYIFSITIGVLKIDLVLIPKHWRFNLELFDNFSGDEEEGTWVWLNPKVLVNSSR